MRVWTLALAATIALVTAAPATAAGPGSTLWAGVPTGFGPFSQSLANAGYDTAYASSSDRVDVSDDGRFIAFSAESDGISTEDDNRFIGIFVRDRIAGTTTLVSRSAGAGAAANGHSIHPSISDDARLVAFTSFATNLDPADTDTLSDIYVRDMHTGAVTLVSRAPGAAGDKGNGESSAPDISGNGLAVAFATESTNFVALDADVTDDIYVRRLDTSTTTLASRAGGSKANGLSRNPSISESGSRVAFTSRATNLDAGDADATEDVYLRDLVGITALLSRADGNAGVKANSAASGVVLSGDGFSAAFSTQADNIDDAGNADSDAASDVYVRNLSVPGGDTTLISRATGNAGAKADQNSFLPTINDAGTRIAFISEGDNLGVATTDERPIFIRDLGVAPDTTTLVSSTSADVAGTRSGYAAFAGAGPALAFAARGPSFGQSALEYSQVFFRAPPAAVELMSVVPGLSSPAFHGANLGHDGDRVVSGDGRYVVFSSTSPIFGLPPEGKSQILRRDLLSGATLVVSRGPGLDGPLANGFVDVPTISDDGQRVAFRSFASNLHLDDPATDEDVIVRDVATGETFLASRADGLSGASPVGLIDGSPRIAADGRHVVFASPSATLVPGDGNGKTDVFVRDLSTGSTVLASRADGAAGALGNGNSEDADVTADGRFVAFETLAANFGDGDANALSDIFVRDLVAGTTRLVSRAPGAAGARTGGRDPVISGDGKVAGFLTTSALLGLDGATFAVAVRDLTAATTVVASRASGSTGALPDEWVDIGSLSSDGSLIAFSSRATTLGAVGGPDDEIAWVRRIAANETVLIGRRDGAAGALLHGSARHPSLSGDGTCAAFESKGDEPFAGASPDFAQVYLRVLSRECPKDPPETTVDGPSGTIATDAARFSLTADEPGSTFECRAGAEPFRPCGASVQRTGLPDGALTLEARAIDPAGVVDPTPASRTVTVAVKPLLSAFSFSPNRFRVAKRSTATAAAKKKKKAREGTTIRLRTNEAGIARITFARASAGRRVGKSCRKATRKLRKRKACTRYTDVARISRRVKAGSVTVKFTGRISRKALKPGRHRGSVTVTDAAGNRSAARTASFTVVPR